jgi:hypothetical protein
MILKLGHFPNKTIVVSIRALFEDAARRSYEHFGVELHRRWLQSNDVSRRLVAVNRQVLMSASSVVFVPFAQIADMMIPTTLPRGLGFDGAPSPAGITHISNTTDSASPDNPAERADALIG